MPVAPHDTDGDGVADYPALTVTGGATAANQDTEADLIGAKTETAPASDTASSGLNGRLQRIAQRISSLIALLPTALGGAGGLKVENVSALPAGTNNIGDVDVLTNVHPAALGVAGTGELQGVTSATQLPNLACKYVRFKARITNTGNVYLGLSGVTAPDGTTDTTTGFSLTPGDDSGWIPITNTNLLYRICTGTGDALTFMALV